MKICYLANSSIPSSVASSIQIVKMCEAFSELNNDVTLITTNVSKSKSNIFDYYDVRSKFRLIKIKNFIQFPLGYKYYLFSIISIFRGLKFDPDIFITRNFFTCFLLILFRKKVLLELHHDLSIESRIVRLLVKFTNFLNSKYICKILAITHGVKNEYVEKKLINRKKILVLPSGSALKKKIVRNRKNKKFNIGYLGSLYPSRGINLIKNLAQVDIENDYYLYGNLKDINYYKFINNRKNLFLRNYVPYKQISKILSKMDVVLLPYISSITVAGNVGNITKFTSPLKLFDYLNCGKVILCSNLIVLKEVLKENKNAIFVKNYKNFYAWKNEITQLKKQLNKRIIIAKNNEILSDKFKLKLRAKKILDNINYE